jgi:hypothetical protein
MAAPRSWWDWGWLRVEVPADDSDVLSGSVGALKLSIAVG